MATKGRGKAVATSKAPGKKVARKPQTSHKLSRVELFVKEYLVDLNGRQAAIRAGYSAQSARQTASELLATPDVQSMVQAAMDKRAERTEIKADDVLRRLKSIADADPRELIELHRGCCRYCFGKRHHYQWSPQELREAKAQYARDAECANEKQLKLLRKPDETGGVGYDPRRDPNPSCPECFGEGSQRIVTKDTRDLSPDAQTLYAGVKTTQNGLEIKMHDQHAALRDVGRHLGLFKDKVEHSGTVVTKTYAELLAEIDGAGTGIGEAGGEGRR